MKKIKSLLILFLAFYSFDYFLSKTSISFSNKEYLYGFKNFYTTAKNTKGNKRIILLGGSSLGWGVSAKKLSERLSILTLNSGIHGSVGYQNFIPNIKEVIDKKNDIFIFSPEYELMTTTRFRSEEDCFLYLYITKRYKLSCAFYSLNRILKNPINKLIVSNPEYVSTGFNRYGDYIQRLDVQKNMVGKVDNKAINFKKNFEIFENKYMPYLDKLKKDGYQLIYIPTLIPRNSPYAEKAKLYHMHLFSKYGVSNYEKSKLTLDEKYFYDSNYHLTKEGVELKTKIFQNQISDFLNYQ